MQRAGRHLPRLEHDFDHVEAVKDSRMVQQAQVMLGCAAERFLFLCADRFPRSAEIGVGTRAHLDKGEDFSVAANEIDLAAGDQEIAIENAIPVPAQKRRGDALTIGARLLRRCQRRRRRARGSVESLADELQKGREG